jgi:carbamoyl-phosphate synthase large subunit
VKRILVTGAGGAPATNFVRSLRLAGEEVHLIGVDCDKYYLARAETDEAHLVPRCGAADYLAVLNSIVEESGAGLVFAQPDMEIEVLSERREEVATRLFLPSKETIRTCLSKYASYECWRRHGVKVPETLFINTPEDLRLCFERFGPRIWIREVKGAFGKGSLPTERFEQARAWIDFHQGWGRFTGAECLERDSVTWQSIWRDGELMVAQGRRRLYWEFANRAPSGVTGITGAGVTVSDPVVDDVAERAIRAIDPRPHGIFSVDLTYDRQGVPNPTEINIGRFFTTHLFFSAAGLNMPHLMVKLAFGEEVDLPTPRVNPLPPGLLWVRGMDVEPVLTTVDAVERTVQGLEGRRRGLSHDVAPARVGDGGNGVYRPAPAVEVGAV